MAKTEQASVSLEDLDDLKAEYNKSVKGGKKSFTFKGQEVLTQYAKYLIEYMDGIRKSRAN